MLRCAIRSYKRKWVWKYEDSHRTNIKFYKDTDPFYFWVQVILGKTVGCLFIFIPFYSTLYKLCVKCAEANIKLQPRVLM